MFQSIYGSVKFKHTPSSFLHRCGLRIERETQFIKSILQYGLVFRNSKWSDYTKKNVLKLKDSFEINPWLNRTFIYYSVISYLLYIFYKNYYSNFLPIMFTSSILYSLDDLLSLSKTWFWVAFLLYKSILVFVTKLLTLSFINLFTNSSNKIPFNTNTSNRNFKLNRFRGGLVDKFTFETPLSKVTSFNLSNTFLIGPNPLVDTNFNFENNLYKTLQVDFNSTPVTLAFSNTYSVTKEYEFKKNYLSNNSIFKAKNFLCVNTKGESNLNKNFYLTTLTFQKLNFLTQNKELVNVTNLLGQKLTYINSLRWSYRYNILHRHTMINSHKLTESKKLISLGFFDIDMTNNNLWFSDQYARNLHFGKKKRQLDTLSLVKNNWNILYRSNFGYNNFDTKFSLTPNLLSQDNFIKLSFYESSFHFFIKRVKNFSLLPSNIVTSNPFYLGGTVLKDTKDNISYIHSLSHNSLLKDITKLKANFDICNNNKGGLLITNKKDMVLLFNDSEFLNTRLLEVMYNLTKSNSLLSYKFNIFNLNRFLVNQYTKSFSWSPLQKKTAKNNLNIFLGK